MHFKILLEYFSSLFGCFPFYDSSLDMPAEFLKCKQQQFSCFQNKTRPINTLSPLLDFLTVFLQNYFIIMLVLNFCLLRTWQSWLVRLFWWKLFFLRIIKQRIRNLTWAFVCTLGYGLPGTRQSRLSFVPTDPNPIVNNKIAWNQGGRKSVLQD